MLFCIKVVIRLARDDVDQPALEGGKRQREHAVLAGRGGGGAAAAGDGVAFGVEVVPAGVEEGAGVVELGVQAERPPEGGAGGGVQLHGVVVLGGKIGGGVAVDQSHGFHMAIFIQAIL